MTHALIQADIDLFIYLNSIRHPVLDWFFWIISQLGTYWVAVPAVTGFVLIKSSSKGIVNKVLFVLLVLSVNGIVIAHLKSAVNRPRPAQYFSQTHDIPKQVGMPLIVFPPEEQLDSISVSATPDDSKHQSFPSGHASTAFSSATIIILLLRIRYWPVFLIALLVAYSRIYLGLHFPLDLLGGMIVGVFTALALYVVLGRQGVDKKSSSAEN